ncbi:MAG: sulfotransferase [Proteobacteria bacterium]|nr:sulfotransferase [Pseudomonadota bacterium]MBU1686168.1 sulfotransferase [Pseudomonadota bacterium]
MTAPIFIIGTERSGSNLLRLILNSHPDITVPHPPHILKYFSPLADCYGDLTDPAQLTRLIQDVRGLIKSHIHPWPKIPSVAEIRAALTSPTLTGVFLAVYETHRLKTGKRRWGCKSTFVIDHLEQVLAERPTARFLMLVRDPRDVAVSSRRSMFSPCHPWLIALLWQRQQNAGLRALTRYPENFLPVRYEDLLTEPETTVRTICTFLGEEYTPTMLEFYRTGDAKKSSRLSACWRNTDQPIKPSNQGRYRRELTPEEIRLVEKICRPPMEQFGYSCDTENKDEAPVPSRLRKLGFHLLNLYWRLLVECRALIHDRNYRLHWRRCWFLLRLTLSCKLRRAIDRQGESRS